MESLLKLLPQTISQRMRQLPREVAGHLEEIRIREGRPLEVIADGRYTFITRDGGMTTDANAAYLPDRDDCRHLLDVLTNHSIYSLEEELKRGFITVSGGHRVGLSGKAVTEQGKVKHLRDIASFNIRVAREVKDVSRKLLPKLVDPASGILHHTLLVSPPQQGKTTIIRDIARLLSYGGWHDNLSHSKAMKVGIVDERSEIAACRKGVPSFDVGPRTDVLDACPKAEGMMMMIRAMSPDVIIVDEIGRSEDVRAIHEALYAGIRVVATAHGYSFDEIGGRPMLRELMLDQVFSRYVVLGRTYSIGRIFRIYDQDGRMMESFIMHDGQKNV